MSRRLLAVPLTVAALLVVGLLVPTSASAAAGDGDCAGMTAPPTPSTAPAYAPALQPDSAAVIAGGTVIVPVLQNDETYGPTSVVITSTPTYGATCIDSSGAVEYFADPSSTSRTDTFTYGVTDGWYFRQTTVTVSVQGVLPIGVTVLRKARHGKKARLSFSNPNDGTVVIYAGSPKKRRPDLTRAVAGHGSTVVRSRRPKLSYVVTITDAAGDEVPVSFGTVNTRTGKVKAFTLDDSRARTAAGRWVTRWVTR